jgi:dTDP-4-dehydrorhamnose 3,5-epimerase
MSFHFTKLENPDVIHIKSDIYGDARGYFTETYKYPEFKANGIERKFLQVNHSKSSKGILRGLHYQKDPMAQGKLVTVIEGEIFDVAVDLRVGSPHYGKWVSQILDAGKKNMLYVPEGFAHGFCSLSENTQVIYYCTQVYSPEHERGIIWNDPHLGISWPIKDPILSDKDKVFPELDRIDNNFKYTEKK